MRQSIVAFLILSSSLCFGQNVTQAPTPAAQAVFPPIKIRIFLLVEDGAKAGADDAMLKGYITRELRKCSDVVLVDNCKESILGLYVMSIDTRNRAGMTTGKVLSFTVCSEISNQIGSGTVRLQHLLDDKTKKLLLSCFSGTGDIIDAFMQETDEDSLARVISEDIAGIEGKDIEPIRESLDNLSTK